MKKLVLFLILISPAAQATAWSREQLIKKALAESPNILRAKDSFLSAELEDKNSRVYWLPTLDLLAVHGRQESKPVATLSPWRSETSLLLNESLYDNGESYKKSKIQSLRKEIAKLRYQDLTGLFAGDVFKSWESANFSGADGT